MLRRTLKVCAVELCPETLKTGAGSQGAAVGADHLRVVLSGDIVLI